jgi:hypothetical protein
MSTTNQTQTNNQYITLAKDKIPDTSDLKLNTEEISSGVFSRLTSNHKVVLDDDYKNHFLNTILACYNKHLPLRLSVLDIHFAILSMVSQYVNEDPERFRHVLVSNGSQNSHSDVKVCTVEHVPTSDPDQGWENTIKKWVSEIDKDIPNKQFLDAITSAYSVSTDLDFVVSLAYIMDTVKSFYDFKCYTECGIPAVHLEGSEEDWQNLLSKVNMLIDLFSKEKNKKYEYDDTGSFNSKEVLTSEDTLSGYLQEKIVPVIQNLILTKQNGNVKDFWSHIISHTVQHGSGAGTYWDGWLTLLFPQIRKNRCNEIHVYKDSRLDSVQAGITDIPFEWNAMGRIVKLRLNAGFHGTEQFSDGSLKTITGWVINKRQ